MAGLVPDAAEAAVFGVDAAADACPGLAVDVADAAVFGVEAAAVVGFLAGLPVAGFDGVAPAGFGVVFAAGVAGFLAGVAAFFGNSLSTIWILWTPSTRESAY